MILLDVSQIVKSAVAAIMNNPNGPNEVDPGMIRHTALNSIRAIRSKHSLQYGELVICADSMAGKSWRKEIFPYYKARRANRYEDSKIDWLAAMPMINSVFEELRDNFPYKFVMVNTCEADDVIGAICEAHGDIDFPYTHEKILIVSSDRDFLQLQKYSNVSQYNNITAEFMRVDDGEKYLFEKILGGDAGDDIPNVRAADDHFMGDNGRQKPITAKIKEDFEAYKITDPQAEVRFARNKAMIDLGMIPQHLKELIIEEFGKPGHPIRRSKIQSYLSEHRLRDLLANSGDF